MAIKVQLFAAFADGAGVRELTVAYRPGMRCRDVWESVRLQYPRVPSVPVLFAIDNEYVQPDTEVADGQAVMLFPPLSGGSPSYIYDAPLLLERAMEAIRDPEAGGEAVFVGRVRRHSRGKAIRWLFYECQVPMAEKQIDVLIGEMRQRWPLRRIHVEHRIGRLEVGDIAVIIAVSADHRAEALEACRYGIDEFKKRVPIWKKEVSDDGEEWI